MVVGVTEKSVIVNVSAFDVPPPGVGFTTVTAAVPAAATSAAVMAAVNCVALTNVVVRALPFHCTADVLMKFVPFTVSVNAAPPTGPMAGASEVSVGTGFDAVIVNVSAFDVVPVMPSGSIRPNNNRRSKHFHRNGSSRKNIRSGDGGRELCCAHKCCCAVAAIPLHHGCVNEVAPVHGQRKCCAAGNRRARRQRSQRRNWSGDRETNGV